VPTWTTRYEAGQRSRFRANFFIELLLRPERVLLNLLPVVGAFSALPLARRHDTPLFVVCSSPLISMSVCPDKSNTSLFGDEEVAISGYVTLPCSASLLRNFQFYLQRVSAKIRTLLMSKYDITLLGTTRPITFDVSYSGQRAGLNARTSLTARATINRHDFGLGQSMMVQSAAGKTATVEIALVAVQQADKETVVKAG
jgi:hypothetical protein